MLLGRDGLKYAVDDARQRMIWLKDNLAAYEMHVARYYFRRQAWIAAANRSKHVVEAWVDAFTVLFLIFFLGVLLYGALGSTAYSLGYWGDEPVSYFAGLATGSEEIGRLERSLTAWRPYIWPIKVCMIVGFFLMLLQAVAELIKDIATLRGQPI